MPKNPACAVGRHVHSSYCIYSSVNKNNNNNNIILGLFSSFNSKREYNNTIIITINGESRKKKLFSNVTHSLILLSIVW